MKLFLGKRPATSDPRDLRFGRYRAAALPKRPRAVDRSSLVRDWQELGNDEYGDCVWAGGAHETMLWTAEAGAPARFSTDSVLSDYASTGFDRNNPAKTDNGTDVRQALLYRQQTGLVDAAGQRHKLGAFVAITPGNLEHVLEAVYLLSAVGVGLRFPESAEQQFGAGQMWSVVKGSPICGGHYVPVVGYTKYLCGLTLACVTWGKLQLMTQEFFLEYCDEAWGLLSPEMFKEGKSPEGYDIRALSADLDIVRAE